MSSDASLTTALRANLVVQRELREFTQAQLGRRAGIAPAAISHFETGQRVPSLESLVKLADALSCSVDVLVGRASGDRNAHVDPLFVRASRADARTLDAVRRVTAALLGEGRDEKQKS
jgi:transcriptional regulator with XRE-family HTH domain